MSRKQEEIQKPKNLHIYTNTRCAELVTTVREVNCKLTVTAGGVEFGLDNGGGNEIRSLTSLSEESLDLGFGADVAVLLEFLPHLRRRLPQHQVVPCERFSSRS